MENTTTELSLEQQCRDLTQAARDLLQEYRDKTIDIHELQAITKTLNMVRCSIGSTMSAKKLKY